MEVLGGRNRAVFSGRTAYLGFRVVTNLTNISAIELAAPVGPWNWESQGLAELTAHLWNTAEHCNTHTIHLFFSNTLPTRSDSWSDANDKTPHTVNNDRFILIYVRNTKCQYINAPKRYDTVKLQCISIYPFFSVPIHNPVDHNKRRGSLARPDHPLYKSAFEISLCTIYQGLRGRTTISSNQTAYKMSHTFHHSTCVFLQRLKYFS